MKLIVTKGVDSTEVGEKFEMLVVKEAFDLRFVYSAWSCFLYMHLRWVFAVRCWRELESGERQVRENQRWVGAEKHSLFSLFSSPLHKQTHLCSHWASWIWFEILIFSDQANLVVPTLSRDATDLWNQVGLSWDGMILLDDVLRFDIRWRKHSNSSGWDVYDDCWRGRWGWGTQGSSGSEWAERRSEHSCLVEVKEVDLEEVDGMEKRNDWETAPYIALRLRVRKDGKEECSTLLSPQRVFERIPPKRGQSFTLKFSRDDSKGNTLANFSKQIVVLEGRGDRRP